MDSHKIYHMPFSKIYQCYIDKAQKKNRTKDEVDQIIYWLCGYNHQSLNELINSNCDVQTFFEQAPLMNPKRFLITGKVCGVQIESIDDQLMRNIRYLDKMVDDLAKQKSLEKILIQG